MTIFGKYFTSIYLQYKSSKLRYDVNGDCRDFYAYLTEQDSDINLSDEIPLNFEFWKVRGQHYFLPVKNDFLAQVLYQQIIIEIENMGLIWLSHGAMDIA